jgi:hypothetical protein
MSLTRSLVAEVSLGRRPEEADGMAGLGFIDFVGTIIAGRNESGARIPTQTLCLNAGDFALPVEVLFGPLSAAHRI